MRFIFTFIDSGKSFHPFRRIINVVTFYMNARFADVTLNSFIFVIDIFCTNCARKFGMIDIIQGLVSVYYIMIV